MDAQDQKNLKEKLDRLEEIQDELRKVASSVEAQIYACGIDYERRMTKIHRNISEINSTISDFKACLVGIWNMTEDGICPKCNKEKTRFGEHGFCSDCEDEIEASYQERYPEMSQ